MAIYITQSYKCIERTLDIKYITTNKILTKRKKYTPTQKTLIPFSKSLEDTNGITVINL